MFRGLLHRGIWRLLGLVIPAPGERGPWRAEREVSVMDGCGFRVTYPEESGRHTQRV